MAALNDAQRLFYRQILGYFPTLEAALDPTLVGKEIARAAPPWYPAGVELEAALGKVYVKPGKYVKLIYHFSTSGDTSTPATNLWVAGRVLHKGKAKQSAGALSLWDRRLILTPFENDKNLAGIEKLSNARWALDYVRKAAKAFGVCGDEIHSVSVDPFKYVPGKRILFRYRIHCRDQELCSYVKLYHDEAGALSAEVQHEVSRLLQKPNTTASVPGVYLYDNELQVMFQEDWGGTCLAEIDSVVKQPQIWQRVLTATHDLHQLRPSGLGSSRLGWSDHLKKISKDVRETAKFIPELGDSLEAALNRFQAVFSETSAKREGFLHASLNPSQILVGKEQIGFVDFDGATMGDPLYDVCELLTGLIHKAWMCGVSLESLQAFWILALMEYARIYAYSPSLARANGYFLMFFLNKTHQRLKEVQLLPENAIQDLREILDLHSGRFTMNDEDRGNLHQA